MADYIPQNTERVIKIANLETTRNDLASSHLFAQLNEAILYDFLKSQNTFIAHLRPRGESVLCFQKPEGNVRHFTFITRAGPSVFQVDSIANAVSTKQNYKGYHIEQTIRGALKNYSATLDSIFIASSSEKIIKEIIDNKTESDPVFQKAFALKTKDGLVTLMQPDSVKINDLVTVNLASWAALELDIFPDGVSASGVILDRDTLPQLLSVFRGLHPRGNSAAAIIPVEALQARAITYDDMDRLEQNLQKYHNNNLKLDPLFGSINEIVGMELADGKAIVLKSIDPNTTIDEFRRFATETSTFREVVLFSISEETSLFAPFYPLLETPRSGLAFQWDDFFVFTESEALAQQLITAYKNGTTLVHTAYYKNTISQLSQASSFTVYNLQGKIGPWMAPFFDANTSEIKKYPLAVLQLSYDRDFAHVNLVCKEASAAQESTGLITQVFSKTLDHAILGNPQFFTNHRTRGKDVVVQDIQNQLYLISASGRILWKKQLDGAILGNIEEVDILRNGKKQLAFVTQNTFYVLDRTGKPVAPFPKKFKDKITQPLALFDYDNRRNYRFVIVQGAAVMMFDSKGKTVTGFTFKKTASRIVLPPQHLRMANKDYILIAEENGKLNVLSRVGKDRIKVNKTFRFSEMPISREGTNFVVITQEHNKESISRSGKVTSTKLKVSQNYWFEVRGDNKVTLDDNLLRINGKLIELPFGIYTRPLIFTSNRKTYITVSETQEKKVYVLDKSGTLLNGFPIYGNGLAALGDARNNGKNALVVKGNENEVLLYTLE
jgi:hypothetical protein